MSLRRLLLVKASNDCPLVTFPLGLMYLASAAKAALPELDVRLVDLRLSGQNLQTLERVLVEFRPDAVGISLLSVELGSLPDIIRRVRGHSKSAPIIAGGPHPSSDPQGTLAAHPDLDFVAVGEGELTFVEWCQSISAGRRDFASIDGLHWRGNDGAIIANAPRGEIKEVESVAAPDYSLARMEDYWNEWSMGDASLRRYHRYMNLFTSRACPYKCTYCHELFGKGFRSRSPEHVVAEMEHLQRTYGIEEFEILDDIFNFNIERAKTICRMMIMRGIKATLSFPNGLRTDRLDKELIGLLAKAGTRHMSIAVETAAPRLQKQIRKNLKLDYVFEMIEECWRQKIQTRGFFMLGFPSETREEMLATIDYACRSKLTVANFFIVIPYKGTALEQENQALVESMNIDYGKIDYWTSDYNMAAVPRSQLKWIQRWAILRFCLAPRRVWYVLRVSPDPLRAVLFGLRRLASAAWSALSIRQRNWRKRDADTAAPLLDTASQPA